MVEWMKTVLQMYEAKKLHSYSKSILVGLPVGHLLGKFWTRNAFFIYNSGSPGSIHTFYLRKLFLLVLTHFAKFPKSCDF